MCAAAVMREEIGEEREGRDETCDYPVLAYPVV